jgi:hypothetical protein
MERETPGPTMDPRCKTCPHLCKRLDAHEEPASHAFEKLSLKDVAELLPAILTEYELWRLDILKQAPENNRDMKLLFKPKEKNTQDPWLTVNAEGRQNGGTSLVFNYQVPESCCDFSPFVSELSDLVRHSVDVLSYTDRLLSH